MIRLKVEGMTCGHCVKAVREALSAVPGVDRVEDVSLERGEALVTGSANAELLLTAVREEGYEVSVS